MKFECGFQVQTLVVKYCYELVSTLMRGLMQGMIEKNKILLCRLDTLKLYVFLFVANNINKFGIGYWRQSGAPVISC